MTVAPVDRARRRRLVVLAASLSVLGAAAPAGAASDVTSGWWASSPLVVAPDVEEGQLLVQSGPTDAPLAYAGISFVLEEDEDPESLTLTVVEGSASTPASPLILCALDAPATAAAGEPADDGPTPDCATEVEAAPSSDGSSYTFDVTAFAAEGALDVAVLPGPQTTRVVLEAPTTMALTSPASINPIGGGPGSGSGSFSPPPPPSGSSGGGTSGAPSSGSAGGSFTAPPPSPSVSVPPSSTATPSAGTGSEGDDEEAAAPLRPPTPFEPAASVGGSSGGGSFPAALLFVLLAGAAATLWTMAGREAGTLAPEPEPAA